MDLGISGKTALVAASTGGLGLAIVRALAAEGVRVAVTGRRLDRAKEIAADLEADGHTTAVGIEADLSTPAGVATAVERSVEALGPIDILVLNGPGPKPGAAAATLSADDIAAAFELLVKPHHALVSHVLPGMRERRWGRILAVGSSGVVAPLPNLAVSNTGRAALAGYLKTLAAEVALDAVTVNMLLPGRIATDRVAELDQAAAKRRGTTVEEIQLESRKTIPGPLATANPRNSVPPPRSSAAPRRRTSPASRSGATAAFDPQPLNVPPSPPTRRNPMTSTATDHTTATSADRALITARHLINGEWLGEADTERMNPARPGELAALSPAAPPPTSTPPSPRPPPPSRPGPPCPPRPAAPS